MIATEPEISLLYSGLIYDAMKQDIGYSRPFVLDNSIRALHGGKIFGPAFTCRGEEVLDESGIQDSVRIDMLASMTEGCVKIVSNGSASVAISGDITCLLDQRHGAVGCILDGFVRDIDVIRENLPAYAVYGRGYSPIDAYGKWQIGAYQVPVYCKGIVGDVLINPGDFIFADESGALVVPAEHKEEVLARSLERYYSEARVRERLKGGESLDEVYKEEARW